MENEKLIAGTGKIFRDVWRVGFVGAGATIKSAFLTERDRWPLWIPVLFGIGISVYFALPIEPPYWLGLLSLIAAASCLWVQRNEPRGLLIAIGLVVVAAGFAAAQMRTYSVITPILEYSVRSVHVSGRVRKVENHRQGIRVVLEDTTFSGPAMIRRPANTMPERIRITVRGSTGLRPGDLVSTRASLRPPPGPAAPNAFDFGRMAFFQGFGAVGYATGRIQVLSNGSEGIIDQITNWISVQRLKISDNVLEAIPDERGTVAVALLIGDRGAIPERLLVAMRDSGLAHLLAISGLHVGLFAGLLLAVSRNLFALAVPLALRFPVKKWAAVFSLVGAFGYLLMTGATIPTQRAFLMITLGLLAIVFDRVPISMTVVAWAAIGLLLTFPESLPSAGFQMSFAAVVALIAAYEVLGPKISRFRSHAGAWRRGALYITGVLLTTLIASLATAPFAAFHFNRIAVYGLAANLVAVPVMALWIMPWALVTYLFFPTGWYEWALTPMIWGIGVVLEVAQAVASWPGAVRLVPAMPVSYLAVTALGGLWFCIWTTRLRLLGLGGLAAGLVITMFLDGPDILVNERGNLHAVRLEGDHYAFSSQKPGFVRDYWLRRLAVVKPMPWPADSTEANAPARCDLLGCRFNLKGRPLAISADPRSHPEDCTNAEILISSNPVRISCPMPKVIIDRFDLWREGAHAIYVNEESVRIDTVRQYRGIRPWSP